MTKRMKISNFNPTEFTTWISKQFEDLLIRNQKKDEAAKFPWWYWKRMVKYIFALHMKVLWRRAYEGRRIVRSYGFREETTISKESVDCRVRALELEVEARWKLTEAPVDFEKKTMESTSIINFFLYFFFFQIPFSRIFLLLAICKDFIWENWVDPISRSLHPQTNPNKSVSFLISALSMINFFEVKINFI